MLLVLLTVLTWMHYRQRMHQEREESLQRILDAQEAERSSIAREVHDNLGPVLSITLMQAETAKEAASSPAQEQLLHNIYAQLQQAVFICRDVSHALTPFLTPNASLQDMLAPYISQINQAGKLQADFNYALRDTEISIQKAVSLCRVILELFNNTIRHAAATTASLSVAREGGSLLIIYTDNGKGLQGTAGKGMGMKNMAARIQLLQGQLQIEGNMPAAGFRVQIRVPLHKLKQP